MPLLSHELLEQIGVTMSPDDMDLLSTHFETTLDERVTNEVIAELSDEQVDALAQLREGSDAQLSEWLKQNVPDLKEIIEDETAILLGELAEHSDSL